METRGLEVLVKPYNFDSLAAAVRRAVAVAHAGNPGPW